MATYSSIEDTVVVDCDVHIQTNVWLQEEIAERLDEPYRSHVDPNIDTVGKAYGGDGRNTSLGGQLEYFKRPIRSAEDITEPLCDEHGIDHILLNTFHRVYSIRNSERALQEMRASNDILIEKFLDADDRFSGLLSLRMDRPEAAVKEIERVGDESNVVGLFIANVGTERPLGDPRYDQVYRAAEDYGLQLIFHPAAAFASQREFPVLSYGLEEKVGGHALSFPFANMLTLTSLIVQGTPVKFPDLSFVILESGLGWIPYMMARLNNEYHERRSEAPLLEKSPEAYIRERFYFGTQPLEEFNNPSHMRRIMEIVGPDSIMYGSDFPHHDFDNVRAIDNFFRHFSPEDREKMLGGNAIDVFGLDG